MKRIIVLIFFLNSLLVNAQDIHFSQFNEQPSLVNPALTGVRSPLRFSVGYRNQWRSIATPYVTSGASFESRLNTSSWQPSDKTKIQTSNQKSLGKLAAGLSIYKDNAGDGNMQSIEANLSLATFVATGKKSFLSVGLQASFVQRKINSENLIFPNQYNGSGYDASLNSNENFQNQTFSYPDFAAGFLWSYGQNDPSIFGKRQLKANLGFSLYHLSKPRPNFLTNAIGDRSLKYVFHGDLLLGLPNPDYAIAPSYLLQFRGKSNELLLGMLVKRYFKIDSKYTGIIKRSAIGFGAYYRNKDAAIISITIEIKEQFYIGVSYDLNVSKLKTGTNARGGFELTLKYTPARAPK
ncbi:PorP/SprF family type IX secretion system membrane protein [Aurantibacillus circumpalustris]|uniref:PorP/SprF family type IX secretion system membrane protein n=1 Tax=Aurantibacillus circumpalustris TaxID=3036359 RepID=UPI00295A601E|nr:PorP/SprF family type IX secretion system membrane protein [Aurantibacillus circumpalustris]